MYLQTLVKTTSPALTVVEAEISSSTCASKYIGPLRHQLNEPVIMWQSEVFLWSGSLTEPSPWKLKETHRSCRFINEAIFGGSPGGLSGKMDHVKRITLLRSSGWTSDVFLFEMNQHEGKELLTTDSEAQSWAGLEKLTRPDVSADGRVNTLNECWCDVMWCANTELLFIHSSLQGPVYLVWQLDSWDQAIMCDKPSGECVQTHQSVNMSLSS